MVRPLASGPLRERSDLADDELVELRSRFLAPADGDLLRAAWIYRQPVAQIARLSGLPPRQVRRRVRRLLRRVHAPEFLAAVRAMPLLTPAQAAVARLHVCGGMSLRDVAEEMVLPYFRVRRIATEVWAVLTGIYRMAGMAARRPGGQVGLADARPEGASSARLRACRRPESEALGEAAGAST